MVVGTKEVAREEVVQPLKPVLRIATAEDDEHAKRNREKEREAMAICQKKILKHNLDMKLIDAEYTFDNNKILFYFTADGRIDFRELVKDLAVVFKMRIELLPDRRTRRDKDLRRRGNLWTSSLLSYVFIRICTGID